MFFLFDTSQGGSISLFLSLHVYSLSLSLSLSFKRIKERETKRERDRERTRTILQEKKGKKVEKVVYREVVALFLFVCECFEVNLVC
jgi:hypothetical protein